MKTKELIQKLGFDLVNLECGSAGGGIEVAHLEVTPEEFLNYAEKDLIAGDKHALVNALTNSKRAIDCQIEKIILTLGVKSKRNSIPSRLELISNLGIIAPRILTKVTKLRNYLEHNFKTPEKEKVEDSFDIASLFVESTRRMLIYFFFEFSIFDRSKRELTDDYRFDNCLAIHFDDKKKEYELIAFKEGKEIGSAIVSNSEEEYILLLKLAVSLERHFENDEVIKELLK